MRKRDFLFGASLLLVNSAFASDVLLLGTGVRTAPTRYYVSNVASNGYVVGNDANAGTTKGTAFLTLTKALATYVAGDVITLNDGTYLSTDGSGGGTQFIASKGGVIQAENSGQATLNATGGAGTATLLLSANIAGLYNIQGIVIDARNTQDNCVKRSQSTSSVTVSLKSVTFNNFNTWAYRDDQAITASLRINNCTFSTTTSAPRVVGMTQATFLDVVVDGLTGSYVNNGNSGASFIFLQTVVGRTASAATINNVVASATCTNGGTAAVAHGVQIVSVSNVVIQNCNFTLTAGVGSTSALYAVKFTAANSLDSNGSIVRNNTFTVSGAQVNGVFYGTDTSGANNNLLESAQVHQNTIICNSGSGTTHGISINWQSSGTIFRNFVQGFNQSIQFVNMTAGLAYSNIIVAGGYAADDGYIWIGGSTGVTIANNTLYFTGALSGKMLHAKDWNSVHTTGLIVTNNLFYTDSAAAVGYNFITVDNSNTVTFTDNLYYSTQALPTACFSYQGTTYDVVSTWSSAHESSAIAGNPLLVNPPGGDFNIGASSAARGAGVAVVGVAIDYSGLPFATPPSVGALEYAA